MTITKHLTRKLPELTPINSTTEKWVVWSLHGERRVWVSWVSCPTEEEARDRAKQLAGTTRIAHVRTTIETLDVTDGEG